MDVVGNAHAELKFGATEGFFGVLGLSSMNLVLSNLVRESHNQVVSIIFLIVNQKVHVAILVVKSDSLGNRESAATLEEFLSDRGLVASERVSNLHGERIVFLNSESGNAEKGGEHSSLEGSTLGNSLEGVQGALGFSLFENLLSNSKDDRSASGITEHLNIVNFITSKA